MFSKFARRTARSVLSIAGALVPRRSKTPAGSAVVLPWREDYDRAHVSVGLTPSRALALLHAADGGQPQLQFELYTEMLARWPRLAAVTATRRMALCGLPWDIAPAQSASADQRRLAQRAAEYVRETLANIDGLHTALDHLADAVGYGVALAELVWDGPRLVDVAPTPFSRLVSTPGEPWRLRVRTADKPVDGVALDELPNKWVVQRARAGPGRLFDAGLMRPSVLLYLAHNLTLKDWLIYSQVAGMPLRVAQFEPGAPDSDKQTLLSALRRLGTDATAIFSKNIDLRFVEAASSSRKPYEAIQHYCNTEITILWLGQNLTTDVHTGSRAAAQVHERVREDLLALDLADEAHVLRRDLIAPLVRARFGPDAPLPHWRRSLSESTDTATLARTLGIARRELGMRVPARWAHRALGIPEPAADEPVLAANEVLP